MSSITCGGLLHIPVKLVTNVQLKPSNIADNQSLGFGSAYDELTMGWRWMLR